MTVMLKFTVVGLLVAFAVAACGDGQTRSVRTAGPSGEPALKTYCARVERCVSDAREVCPDGYEKLHVENGAREIALTYKCHGRENW